MYSFKFNTETPFFCVKEIDECELSSGICLWIWHANKIPPHIGISLEGKYFSLKVNGKDENLPVNKVIDIIQSKKIGTFLVKIESNKSLKDIQSVFSKYSKAESLKTTCLNPIQEIFDIEGDKMILAELLNNFQGKGIITKVFSINLDNDFNGVPKYGKEEIEARLIHLENAKRSKNILKSS